MKYFLYTHLYLFLSFFVYGLSAQESNVEIRFKDYHSANITNVSITKDESNYFTSDDSGKILMYSAEQHKYLKTIRAPSGIPIKTMRLVKNDSILLFTQKYDFSDGTADSLMGIRLHDNKLIVKNKLVGSFVQKQDDALILSSNNGYLDMLEIFDMNMKPISKIFTNQNAKIAAFSNSKNVVAYIESDLVSQKKLVSKNITENRDAIDILIPENLYVLHIFFDKDSNELFVLAVDEQKNKLEIYNISSSSSFTNPSFTIDFDLDRFVNVSQSISDNKHYITLTTIHKSPSINPLVITKKGIFFEFFIPSLKSGAAFSAHLPEKNQFLFFEGYNQNFNSSLNFSTYDFSKKEIIESFPKTKKKFYTGSFLPDDSWVIFGNESNEDFLNNTEYQLKYYKSGTFNNRFALLDYKDYLEVNHQMVDYAKSEFRFNKHTGIHPFSGYKKISSKRSEFGFYKYNLLNDEVDLISLLETNYNSILDYNNETNNLLLSIQTYSNYGFAKPQQFQILNDKTAKILDGTYKFGKFSNDGEYLLTINSENKIEIRSIETNNIHFTEKLVDGNYELFTMAENGFIITNSYRRIDINKCNRETIFIGYFDEREYSSEKKECVLFTDLDLMEDKLSVIVEGLGVIFGNQTLKFPSSEFPKNISLNKDGTKAMISLSNGKISIYDTSSLSELGSMVHPDKKTHLFLDTNGNFFSNVNSENYIIAKKDNQIISVSEVEKDFFNPEKVLEIFGSPNEEYVSVLNKALSIRAENKYKNVDSINIATNLKPTIKNERSTKNKDELPDLYVLTIGISDYLDSDYNLTFADKDAIDIAKIYGKLDSISIASYNRKFYGSKYELNDYKNDTALTLKWYQDFFERLGKLVPVSVDGTRWLVKKHDRFLLWNFSDKTVFSLTPPKGFKTNLWLVNELIFINPDNSGFYMKTETNEYYDYQFSSKSFDKIKSPFPSNQWDWIRPLTKDRWVKFELSQKDSSISEEVIVSFENNNTSGGYENITFSAQPFNEISETGKLVKNEYKVYGLVPRARAISSNGNHFIYSGAIDGEESLFYKNLNDKNSIPVKIKDSINYGSDIFLSDDGLTYTIIKSSDDNHSSIANTYTLNGELVTTINLQSDSFTFFNNHY